MLSQWIIPCDDQTRKGVSYVDKTRRLSKGIDLSLQKLERLKPTSHSVNIPNSLESSRV